MDILSLYLATQTIPHILFYGSETKQKYDMIYDFFLKFYDNNEKETKKNIYYMDCAQVNKKEHLHILKTDILEFAQIQSSILRVIIFCRANYLHLDAQAVLRRYIEQYGNFCRFIFIVEHRSPPEIISPILSRLFPIYCNHSDYDCKPNYITPYNADTIKDKQPLWELSVDLDNQENKLLDQYQNIEDLYSKGYGSIQYNEFEFPNPYMNEKLSFLVKDILNKKSK